MSYKIAILVGSLRKNSKRITRLASVVTLVSLATFGALVGTYKLLF